MNTNQLTGIAVCTLVLCIRIGFDADSHLDPDPAFYLNADPNPDQGSQTNADPDPDPGHT
jgi:hypothetical protein